MRNPEDIKAGLAHFYGTQEWHRHNRLMPAILLTDGAKYVAEECEAYWLMDLIGAHLPTVKADPMARDFCIATLRRKGPSGAEMILERDTDDVLLRQQIELTDFPLDEISFYFNPMGDGHWVIMLKSEH